jgi:protein SCO1/2
MKNIIFGTIALMSIFALFNCGDSVDNAGSNAPLMEKTSLPFLGFHDTDSISGDTIYHTIRPFEFMNQDSQKVTNEMFENKVYAVDFFFISCPTICPKLTKQMLRVHEKFKDNPNFLMLSHTVDTKHDTIPRLKSYAKNLGADTQKWHFVTGDKSEIYTIAEDYFSVALENDDAPGGFDHSGRLILVDGKGRVRSFCNGTEPEEVDVFMKDIELLLKSS